MWLTAPYDNDGDSWNDVCSVANLTLLRPLSATVERIGRVTAPPCTHSKWVSTCGTVDLISYMAARVNDFTFWAGRWSEEEIRVKSLMAGRGHVVLSSLKTKLHCDFKLSKAVIPS